MFFRLSTKWPELALNLFFILSVSLVPIPVSIRMVLLRCFIKIQLSAMLMQFWASGMILFDHMVLGTTPNIAPPSILKLPSLTT